MKIPLTCRLFGHKWGYCECVRCGTHRNTEHVWKGCKCALCGSTRNEEHKWNGCKCSVCGKKRNEEHRWNGCKCSVCGMKRNEGHMFRFSGSDSDILSEYHGVVCSVCGVSANRPHSWKEEDDYRYCSVCGVIDEVCPKCGKYNAQKTEVFDYERFEDRPGRKCLSCGKQWVNRRSFKRYIPH